MTKKLLLVLFTIQSVCLSAQIGGQYVYQFLNLSNSARVSGLGGNLITVKDDDINLAYSNPSLLNADMHQQISFNHSFFLGGINHGYVGYGHEVKKLDMTFHAGMQYVSYGDFDATDVFGNINGTFKASEYAFTLGGSRMVYDRLTVGANIKLITSQLESYNSFGISTDVAATYQDSSGRFTATLVFKNAGAQIATFSTDNNEPLPFEVQAGVSQKLKHLPFRFSVVYRYLNKDNITYDDPNTEETTFIIGDGSDQGDNAFGDWVDNFFRHLVFSGEFLFGKKENLRLRMGYSHLLHQEMTVRDLRSLAGFSFGFGFKINRFRIDYGRYFHHLAGGNNHFTISTNIKEFKGRRKIKGLGN